MIQILKSQMINEIIEDINEPEYEEFIKKRCEYYLKDEQFNTELKPRYNKGYISNSLFDNKPDRCIANVYNNGCVRQCSNKIKCEQLCGKHKNIKSKYGYLIFGDINNDYRDNIRYDEEKCGAITFKKGILSQCSKEKCENNLCSHHHKYNQINNCLKYGSLFK